MRNLPITSMEPPSDGLADEADPLLSEVLRLQEGGEWESACTLLARALERTPNDERLYLRFRQAVEDLYDQLHHQQGSFSFNDLPAGPEVVGTIDLDLIFLHENALGALASRLRTEPLPQAVLERLAAQSPKELKRAELALAIMTARAASTGYMASAPPSLPLDHYFDVLRRGSGTFASSERRILHTDYAGSHLVLFHKEEPMRRAAFGQLSAVFAVEPRAISLYLGNEHMTLRLGSEKERGRLLTQLQVHPLA